MDMMWLAAIGGNAPFSPDTIPGVSLPFWFKADSITGLADGATITTWNNSGSAGGTLSQATESLRFLYKSNILNGYPVARSDGTDDLMVSTANIGTVGTMFAVMNVASFSGGIVPCLGECGISLRIMTFFPDILTAFADGGDFLNVASRINGVETTTVPSGFFLRSQATTPVTMAEPFKFGFNTSNATFTAFDLAEFIAYDTQLSAANILAVETYLNAKYAIF